MCSKEKPEVSASREGGVWAKVGGRGEEGLAMRTTASISHSNVEKYPGACSNMSNF